MKRLPVIPKAVFLGLLITQLLATLHVHMSNRQLHETLLAVSEAGYLAVPNEHIMSRLLHLGPAVFGGLFFTLTVGAGISILAALLGWLWSSALKRNGWTLGSLAILWGGLIIFINAKGFSAMVTSYFLFPPVVVFTAAVRWLPEPAPGRSWLGRTMPVLTIVLLTVAWAGLADRLLFMNIRDYLLLSNPVGQAVDRFYYRYTLYPAQVFKPLSQKTLRTCSLEGFTEQKHRQRMMDILERNDYLPVGREAPVDLTIAVDQRTLKWMHGDRVVLEIGAGEFTARPQHYLEAFSTAVDRHGAFRQATFLCLLLGFPVLLYIVFFAAAYGFASLFTAASNRLTWIASLTCLLIGLGLLAAVHGGRREPTPAPGPGQALQSDAWRQRTEGLRTIVEKRLEINDYLGYRRSLTSPHVPERYWLTKALGLSRAPETRRHVLSLLDDPHPNVVSMAFQAAGKRGRKDWIPEIIERILRSHHWYNQWYAYRALKALGWHQGQHRR